MVQSNLTAVAGFAGARTFQRTALAVAISQCCATAGLAATLTVTTVADSGAGSLRQAVIDAVSGDVITFDASLSGQAITLASGMEANVSPLTLDGDLNDDESPDITIDCDNSTRFLDVDVFDELTIDGLNIINCTADGQNGGAIRTDVASNLRLVNSTLSGNTADSGGAIFARDAYVEIVGSTLTGNSAEYAGGAVYAAYSDLILTDSTVSGNDAQFGGGVGVSYGKYASEALEVNNSTISGNTSETLGAGISLYNASALISGSVISDNDVISDGVGPSPFYGGGGVVSYAGEFAEPSLEIVDSLISGNTAPFFGGGVAAVNKYGSTSVVIGNSTVVGNSAKYGGGLAVVGFDAGENSAPVDFELYNSTFSANSAYEGSSMFLLNQGDEAGTARILNSTLVAAAYSGSNLSVKYIGEASSQIRVENSLIQQGEGTDGCFITWDDATISGNNISTDESCGDAAVTDPLLLPLQDNGGPLLPGGVRAPTHLLSSGSPAINAGNTVIANDANLLTDQRGDGFPRILNAVVDLGAVEVFDDLDGIVPGAEEGVPDPTGGGTGDGNGDSIPDSEQSNVGSLPSSVGGAYGTLEVGAGIQLGAVEALDPPENLPAGVSFPFGFFAFTASGVSGNLDVSLYVPESPEVNGYWKRDNNGSWQEISTSVTAFGNKTRVNFTIEDNGPFDTDPAVGVIRDPGGPGFAGPMTIPTLGLWFQGLLAGLLGLGASLRLRGRRT